MQKEKIKKNKACPVELERDKGFVLLFAMMLSSIILAIALGVLNISLKEIKFGTSAKDTNAAFFAADTGAECALYNDKSVGGVFVESFSPSITCNGQTFPAEESPSSYWSFVIPGLGDRGKGCAKVTVDKTDLSTTEIISKGYNIGDDSCNSTDPNRVERQLELTY